MSRLNDGAHEVREFINKQRYADHIRSETIVSKLSLQLVGGSRRLRQESSGSF